MTKGQPGGKSKRNPVSVHGPWFAMPIEFLRSRAFAELSPQATKMLLDICSQLGPNSRGNGDLSASPSTMKPRGWGSNATRIAALQELLDADLLVITRRGDRRRCVLYAVTLWPMHCDFAKLDVGPGCYVTGAWTKGDKTRETAPTDERPAAWKSLRKNAISPPVAGQPKAVMTPPRDNPPPVETSYDPATGTQPPKTAVKVVPPWDTSLDMPSAGVAGVGVGSGITSSETGFLETSAPTKNGDGSDSKSTPVRNPMVEDLIARTAQARQAVAAPSAAISEGQSTTSNVRPLLPSLTARIAKPAIDASTEANAVERTRASRVTTTGRRRAAGSSP